MQENKDLLSSVLNTAQMGQVGIYSVLRTTMRPGLRKSLETQLQEYSSIEREATSIAAQRGWQLRDVEPAAKAMAKLMTKLRLAHGNTDSKIATMMIHTNTNGMIQGLKELHQFNRHDPQITMLSQKLLDCENANIRQMQGFL